MGEFRRRRRRHQQMKIGSWPEPASKMDAAVVVPSLPFKRLAVLLLSGSDDVAFLKSELRSMLAVIHHSEFIDHLHDLPRSWVNATRKLAYQVEDWLDLHALAVHGGGGGGGSKPSSSSRLLRLLPRGAHMLTTLPSHKSIAKELQALKQRVVKLNKQWELRVRPLWCPLDSPTVPIDPRPIASDARPNEQLVGLDDGPTNEVANMVMDAGDKQAELKIVSIVGMAGSGKTTLASEVYRRLTEINCCFKCRAFVSVGLNPDFGKTLIDMVAGLTNRDKEDVVNIIRNEFDANIITMTREILNKERYLIVVDDLWDMQAWEMIKYCFPENSLGSRIITTTRNLALAKECGDSIYNIPLLSETHSRELFLHRAFGSGHDSSQDLEDFFAQITSRCGGLPLALVTLASIMLRVRSSMGEWESLIGSRWLLQPDANDMMWIFNLSYKDLPPHLRKCILYLSMFPENYKVDTARLVRLWIAEQFIAEGEGRPSTDLEETATSYLNELIGRNMVQPLHLIHDGAPSYCKLHPMMYDFIVCKSMEENFATLVDDQNRVFSINNNTVSSNNITVHRLSLQSSKQDQNLALKIGATNLSHVRSIIVFSQASRAPRMSDLSFVRVLDLEGYDGPIRLDGVNKLLLLRYLGLRGTGISELPASVWELRCLETLDVRSTNVKELPRSIGRLRETLTTLLFSSEGMLNSRIGTKTSIAEDVQHCRELVNLATIDLREHHASFVKSLGSLDSLRMITIIWSLQHCTDESYREALLSCIQKWTNLRSLTIHCGLSCSMEFLGSLSHPPELLEKFMVTDGGFLSVPKWIQNLSFLSFLQISLCRLATDDLKILGDIPKLQLLILSLDFVPREAIEIETLGFSELLRFSVNCPVPWLIFRTGAMPKLTHLQLEFCSGSASQDSVPYGIGNLQRLTEVTLLYNQKWCANSSSVRRTLDAVKRQVAKHRNPINLTINDTKVDVQEEVVEETKSTARIQIGDVQQVGEVIARTRIETWGEIEIEPEGDNINDA